MRQAARSARPGFWPWWELQRLPFTSDLQHQRSSVRAMPSTRPVSCCAAASTAADKLGPTCSAILSPLLWEPVLRSAASLVRCSLVQTSRQQALDTVNDSALACSVFRFDLWSHKLVRGMVLGFECKCTGRCTQCKCHADVMLRFDDVNNTAPFQ